MVLSMAICSAVNAAGPTGLMPEGLLQAWKRLPEPARDRSSDPEFPFVSYEYNIVLEGVHGRDRFPADRLGVGSFLARFILLESRSFHGACPTRG